MTDLIDRTFPIRDGEQLDNAKLEGFLKQQFPDLPGPLAVEQFPSGHSNLTYLVRWGNRELVLRRPPFGSRVKSAHDMGREYRILSRLYKVYPPAPRALVYCEDESVIGAPFYLMERIKGIVLRQAPPPGVTLSQADIRKLCESFIDNLAVMHGVDFEAAGLGDLGKPVGYVERQVTGWIKRYAGSQTDDIPDFEQIAKWAADRIPMETGAALVHGDYKFDNIALDPSDLTRIVGVYDWEMCTLGDPLMDLGNTLSYWVEPRDDTMLVVRTFITASPGSMNRHELAHRYAEKTGRDISNLLFYYCFGLLRLAVIIQQIYYRYAQGLTKDERFAKMIDTVRSVSKAAVRAAETGKY